MEAEKKNFGWYAYYKPDRTIAILGIIFIVAIVVYFSRGDQVINDKVFAAVGSGITALSTYIGIRSSNK